MYLDEIYKIESKLPDLYNKIRILSDYILFNREEKIDEKNYSPSAYVAVTLGNEGKKTIIDSQGIIFPYLLQETIRGFFELFASHGLPENNKKAMYIIRHSDFILAEEWDMRFGVSLYNNIFNDINDKLLIPYVFSNFSQLDTIEFNTTIKNILLINYFYERKFIMTASITINSNLASLTCQRNLRAATKGMNVAMERLSTGYKINSAKDDAAGYAVAAGMEAKINGYDIIETNAQMGLDMLTTQEGVLDIINDYLQRVRDLTMQAANGTYGSDSINAIKTEVIQRMDEIKVYLIFSFW